MSVLSIAERNEKKKKRKLLFTKIFRLVGALVVIGIIIILVISGIYVVNAYRDSDIKVGAQESITVDRNRVNELDVEVGALNFVVKKEGDSFSLSKHEYIEFFVDDDKLVIKEKNRKWFERVEGSVMLIIPEDYDFDEIDIESGGGKVEINELNARNMDLELGAGALVLNKVNVTGKADIDGNTGKVEIKNGNFNNIDCKVDVGSLKFFGKITGSSSFETSVGSCDVKLIGDSKVYIIDAFKGLGDFIIGNYIINEDTIFGVGKTRIKINGGIGGVVVKFVDENGKTIDDLYILKQ